jgi:hypothetical protein
MKFTYDQMRALAGMDTEGKLQIKHKGKILKQAKSKWTALSNCTPEGQKRSPVATVSHCHHSLRVSS